MLESKIKNNTHNPLIKEFVESHHGKKLIKDYLENPSYKTKNKLNDGFKSHYLKIRALSYFGNFLSFEAKSFDKRRRKNSERYIVILDAPVGEEGTTMKENIQDITQNNSEAKFKNWEDQIENEDIKKNIGDLTYRQKEIIGLSFFEDMKDKEIAKKLKISPQSVSKTKLAALKKFGRGVKSG